MKAIVADLLLSSVICCFITNLPAQANPSVAKLKSLEQSVFLSAKVLQNDWLPLTASNFNFETRHENFFLSLENKDYINNVINSGNWIFNDHSLTLNSKIVKQHNLNLNKKPFSHENKDANLILGFHPTFWPSQTDKYWGLTTVEQLGQKKINQSVELKLKKKNPHVLLPEGTSTITVSGGSKQSLVQKNDVLKKFDDFRGGVALHQGVSQDVTLGVGFVYEDFLLGFSQISFQPKNIPLKTTISLMGRDEGLELHSQINFQPADNFVFNFHSQDSEQKFDMNWGIVPGLNLIAKGNSDKESLHAGLNFAFKNKHFAFAASAELSNQDRMKWHLNTKLGALKIEHTNKPLKTNSELNYTFLSYQDIGFECSLFFNYQTQQHKGNEEHLNVWGWRFNSGEKLANNKYSWKFDLGYGSGSQGTGIIASVSKSIKPEVVFKLSYEQISATSNEPKLKLEIGSN